MTCAPPSCSTISGVDQPVDAALHRGAELGQRRCDLAGRGEDPELGPALGRRDRGAKIFPGVGEPGFAPVGKPAVKFVLALVDGEGRVRLRVQRLGAAARVLGELGELQGRFSRAITMLSSAMAAGPPTNWM